MNATTVARSSSAEMALKSSPRSNARGAFSGATRTPDHKDISLMMTPSPLRNGIQPPMATSLPAALAPARNKPP
eukprot:8707447-Lingulodinium_polyedra.AAC.1